MFWRAAERARACEGEKRSKMMRLFLICGLVAIATLMATVGGYRVALNWIPPLKLGPAAETSVIALDRNGDLLRAYTTENGHWRLPVSPEDVDPVYLDMLLAFEDRRFWMHPGVDPIAAARAIWQLVRQGRIVSGASTLSMQVARLVSREHERTLGGKLRQSIRAIDLERRFDKREILALYLRLAPFGGNLEGVRAASLAYFGKEPRRLSAAQAALLVALPQSPENRRPDRGSAAARRARDRVLDVAVEEGVLTREAAERAKAEAVPDARKPFPLLAAHLVDAEVARAPDRLIHRLSIEKKLQIDLERLAAQGARRAGPKLSTAIVVADHSTGEVLARVGSAGYLEAERLGAIDMAVAVRSPGSALKPFIYGLSFDRGIAHPETLIEDRPTRFGTYEPKNFGEDFRGTVSIREALAASLNVPAVKVLEAVGPGRLVARLRASGAAVTMPEDAVPSLAVALGGLGISLTDLTGLYAALARNGGPIRLHHTLDDVAGLRAAEESDNGAERRLLSEKNAYEVGRILRSAPPPPNARGGGIAFKTGTSYGHRDAWAIGYDGKHVIGVWVGRADASATPELVGRTAAAPILFDAFRAVSKQRTPLARPQSLPPRIDAADLPPPLKRFDRDLTRASGSPFLDPPVRIAFPPDRAELAVASGDPLVILRADGGALPLTWLADGVQIDHRSAERTALFKPAGSGFVKITVLDSRGRTDRITVRLTEE